MSPTIDDKNFVLAGPRWSVLKDFHNKWKDLSSSGTISSNDAMPDNFPGQPATLMPSIHFYSHLKGQMAN